MTDGIAAETKTPAAEDVVIKTIQGSNQLAHARLLAPPKPFSRNMVLLYLMCLPAFMCGTMGGYDGSILGSFLVERSFQDLFHVSVDGFGAGYITAMYQIGSCCSIPFIGQSLDRYGRRFGIFIGCFTVVIAVILQGTSVLTGSIAQLLCARFLLGFGGNIAQASGPTYCVEISHPSYRGILTGGQSSMQNLGGILAAVVTFSTMNFGGNAAWLIPSWVQLVLPGIACLTIWFLPESPRWLYTHNKQSQAMAFLTRFHGDGDTENPYVTLQMSEFEAQLDLDGADKKWWDYRVLFRTRSQRYRLGNSLTIGIWGALSSGGLSYYIGAFFKSAGITNANTVLRYNIWQNFVATIASFIGSFLSDHVGRRMLLLPALAGMGLCWVAMAVGTSVVEHNPANAAGAKAGIAFFIIFGFVYCAGITPLQGVYAVEVFSYEQRAKGIAFYSFVVNAVALINQFATPVALANIGWKTYIIFCVWCFVEFVISYFFNVETKGYTLEELDFIFESPNPKKASLRKREAFVDSEHGVVELEKGE